LQRTALLTVPASSHCITAHCTAALSAFTQAIDAEIPIPAPSAVIQAYLQNVATRFV